MLTNLCSLDDLTRSLYVSQMIIRMFSSTIFSFCLLVKSVTDSQTKQRKIYVRKALAMSWYLAFSEQRQQRSVIIWMQLLSSVYYFLSTLTCLIAAHNSMKLCFSSGSSAIVSVFSLSRDDLVSWRVKKGTFWLENPRMKRLQARKSDFQVVNRCLVWSFSRFIILTRFCGFTGICIYSVHSFEMLDSLCVVFWALTPLERLFVS